MDQKRWDSTLALTQASLYTPQESWGNAAAANLDTFTQASWIPQSLFYISRAGALGTLGAFESHYDKFNSVCNIMRTGVDQDQPTMIFHIPTIFRFFFHPTISLFPNIPCYKVPIPTLFQSTHSTMYVCIHYIHLSNINFGSHFHMSMSSPLFAVTTLSACQQ